MPTYRIRSHNTDSTTITAPDERTARRRAMQEFHGSPKPFGRVAWPIDHEPLTTWAVSPQEWTGGGLMVDVVDERAND